MKSGKVKSNIKQKKNEKAYDDYVKGLNTQIQKHIQAANKGKITNFIKKRIC